jgi:hypothetical protein
MKIWILLAIVGVLLFWGLRVREGFDPACKSLGKREVREGTAIRVYTKEECDTLGGNFAGKGECLKKGGGSFTWDCRDLPDTPPTTPSTTAGPTAGGTTGGSSTSEASPNAGPVGSTGKGKEIYGPVFTSLGQGDGGNGKDSSKNNKYPELLGGMGDCSSVRTDQGMRNPSQSWLLSQSGSLPSTASLGCDENSKYLPTSRVPGDQDLIPDPYRLSRNYSTSNYSSKTDPVPFLTDFSAFSK